MSIDTAAASRAKATLAREVGQPVSGGTRNGKAATQRPPPRSEKAVALAAYCDLLRGASLPDDLVAVATAADLKEARRALAEDVDGMITGRGWNRWAIAGRSEMLTRWELATPQRRAEEKVYETVIDMGDEERGVSYPAAWRVTDVAKA